MDKDKYIAVFITTLMIAIPVGAVLILIVYVFGFVAVPEEITTYKFIKDHGSLIAGFMAVLAAAITVYFHMKSTNKAIEANNEASFQEKKIEAQVKFEIIWEGFEFIKINRWAINYTDREKIRNKVSFDEIFSSIRGLRIFFKSHGVNNSIRLLEFIDSYFLIMKEVVEYGQTADLLIYSRRIRSDLFWFQHISSEKQMIVLSRGERVTIDRYQEMLYFYDSQLCIINDLSNAIDESLRILDKDLNEIKRK